MVTDLVMILKSSITPTSCHDGFVDNKTYSW